MDALISVRNKMKDPLPLPTKKKSQAALTDEHRPDEERRSSARARAINGWSTIHTDLQIALPLMGLRHITMICFNKGLALTPYLSDDIQFTGRSSAWLHFKSPRSGVMDCTMVGS